VLAPGGAITVWTYGDPVLDHAPSDALLQRFNHETMGPYWPVERGAVGAAYKREEFPFAEIETPSFSLERSWTMPDLAGYLRSWSSVASYRARHADDPVVAVEEELARIWGDAGMRHTVRWPVTMRAGHV
jgi:hypothetical protein